MQRGSDSRSCAPVQGLLSMSLPPSAPLGLLMLDTAFERFRGDIGHPDTFAFPVLREVVRGASAAVATTEPGPLLEPFIAAGRRLVAAGCVGVSTSCGFLVVHQAALASALSVPVFTSALLEIPRIQAGLPPGRRVGVLTFNPATLGRDALTQAGAATDIPIDGLRADDAMRRDILGGTPSSFAARERDVVAAGVRLVASHPEVGAIVCECTNFPPHRMALQAATGRPVFDIVTALNDLHPRWSVADDRA